MNSSYVVAPKLPMRMYPTPGRMIYDASRLFTGILSRFTLKVSVSATSRLTTESFTIVPFGPRSLIIIWSRGIFTPDIAVSFTATMPAFCDGPLAMVWMTSRVSSTMLNCTPMPSKFPCNDSFICFVSFGVVYEECGSSLSSIPLMASSTSLFSSTEST